MDGLRLSALEGKSLWSSPDVRISMDVHTVGDEKAGDVPLDVQTGGTTGEGTAFKTQVESTPPIPALPDMETSPVDLGQLSAIQEFPMEFLDWAKAIAIYEGNIVIFINNRIFPPEFFGYEQYDGDKKTWKKPLRDGKLSTQFFEPKTFFVIHS